MRSASADHLPSLVSTKKDLEDLLRALEIPHARYQEGPFPMTLDIWVPSRFVERLEAVLPHRMPIGCKAYIHKFTLWQQLTAWGIKEK